jgi:hypothetical protein
MAENSIGARFFPGFFHGGSIFHAKCQLALKLLGEQVPCQHPPIFLKFFLLDIFKN